VAGVPGTGNGLPDRRHGPAASWDGTGLGRILVADEEPRIASFLERGLTANGFTTEVAVSGDEALALARSGRFDLVILDSTLPKMDGFEVLRELRQAGVTVPVVLTTGVPLRDDVGADDFLTKPFHFEELLACVRYQLARVASG
jgi:two-component system, OmpR family, copper resistance phosphate regulon response regulator CusR